MTQTTSNLRAMLFRQQHSTEKQQSIEQPTTEHARGSLTLANAIVRGAGLHSKNAPVRSNTIRQRLHKRLIEALDVKLMETLGNERALENAIQLKLMELIEIEETPLSSSERDSLVKEILHETLGLGPLEPLMSDPDVNDILVNRFDSIWVDRNGRLSQTEIAFEDEDHLLHVINRIVGRIGRRVDESCPIVDARLPDGSRVNAIIPPLALDGAVLSIRRFRQVPFTVDDLIGKGTLNSKMATFLTSCIQARLNILISGGTSAGKTTLLNVLSAAIPDWERIVTIEDTAELQLQQRHVVRLESRPANAEGQGAVAQRELVKNALRMRPDRIVVGEVRGAEALDMLQAMNTGHEGSLTTVHANSPRDALSRIETLVSLAGVDLTLRSIREQIGSAFDLVIQIKRLPDGARRIVSVQEITGVQEGVISLQEIYGFDLEHSGDTHSSGVHKSCGLRPRGKGKFEEAGITFGPELFQENVQ